MYHWLPRGPGCSLSPWPRSYKILVFCSKNIRCWYVRNLFTSMGFKMRWIVCSVSEFSSSAQDFFHASVSCNCLKFDAQFVPPLLLLQSNPPPKSRSYSMVSQGSGSSPMSVRRPSQNNNPNLFGWSQGHKGSSLYSSKRSLLPDHLMDAREVTHQAKTLLLACRAYTQDWNWDYINTQQRVLCISMATTWFNKG